MTATFFSLPKRPRPHTSEKRGGGERKKAVLSHAPPPHTLTLSLSPDQSVCVCLFFLSALFGFPAPVGRREKGLRGGKRVPLYPPPPSCSLSMGLMGGLRWKRRDGTFFWSFPSFSLTTFFAHRSTHFLPSFWPQRWRNGREREGTVKADQTLIGGTISLPFLSTSSFLPLFCSAARLPHTGTKYFCSSVPRSCHITISLTSLEHGRLYNFVSISFSASVASVHS